MARTRTAALVAMTLVAAAGALALGAAPAFADAEAVTISITSPQADGPTSISGSNVKADGSTEIDVAVTCTGFTATGTVYLYQGSTALGSMSLTGGSASFTNLALAFGSMGGTSPTAVGSGGSIYVSYYGDTNCASQNNAAYCHNSTTHTDGVFCVGGYVNPVYNLHGPYTIAQGADLSADSTGTSATATQGTVTPSWSINSHQVSTAWSPTLTWSALEAAGVSAAGDYDLVFSLNWAGSISSTSTPLTVTGVAPTASILSAPATGTAGKKYTIEVGASDPSGGDETAGFDYTVDWGDGSSSTVHGGTDPAAHHTYAAAGDYTLSVTAADQGGQVSEAVTSDVVIAAAPAGSGGSTLAATGVGVALPVGLVIVLLLLGAAVIVIRLRVARR